MAGQPKRRARRRRSTLQRREAPAAPAVAARRPERSVLIVESCPEEQVQMARALRDQGHLVVATGSGEGALALIGAWPVDLVLVSQDLPGRAGVQVTRKLLEAAGPSTSIVLMAADIEAGVCRAALAAGAAGCVMKPLDLSSLNPWLSPGRHRQPERHAPVVRTLRDDPAVAE